MKKIRCCLKVNITFRVIYDTRKYSFYCDMKDKIPYEQMYPVIYQLICLDWAEKYIGWCKDGTHDSKPMLKHLSKCELFQESCFYYILASV